MRLALARVAAETRFAITDLMRSGWISTLRNPFPNMGQQETQLRSLDRERTLLVSKFPYGRRWVADGLPDQYTPSLLNVRLPAPA